MAINPIYKYLENLHELINGMTVAIEVEPQTLFQTSEHLKNKINSVQYNVSSMKDRVYSMNRYWEGRISEFRKDEFNNDFVLMEDLMECMETYVVKLRMIAENYIESESKNTDSAGTLLSNVIS